MYSNEGSKTYQRQSGRDEWRTVTGEWQHQELHLFWQQERDWKRRWAGEANFVSDEPMNFQI